MRMCILLEKKCVATEESIKNKACPEKRKHDENLYRMIDFVLEIPEKIKEEKEQKKKMALQKDEIL